MSSVNIVSVTFGVVGMLSSIVGTWYTLRMVNNEKAKSEFERGQMFEQVNNHKESISRAFYEIEQVKEEQKCTSNTVISIMAGIEYIKDSMSEVKISIKNIENKK